MISIIVSSYKEFYYTQFAESVNNTIGVPFEIIRIQNPGRYSITQAYNMGAGRANYEVLCFMHEDIKFHTKNWGDKLINHFNEFPDLGLIGVAGSTHKTALPTGWLHHDTNANKINIIQNHNNGRIINFFTKTDSNIDYVKTLDGVFLSTKKDVWEEILF